MLKFKLQGLLLNLNPQALRQPVILTFLLHKSATACQICQNMVPNSTLKNLPFIDLKNRKNLDSQLLHSSCSCKVPRNTGFRK